MTLTGAFPRPIPLNPLQQWRYFSQPRMMHDWIRERYGGLVSLHFQGKDYAAILTAEGARQVFAAEPDNYDAFWKESFAGLIGDGNLWVLIQERHRRERHLFAPAVHANHFRGYGSTIRDIAHSHFNKWQPGQTIRAIDTTLVISLDVIMRLIFGVQEEEFMQEGREVFEGIRHLAHPLIVFYPKLQQSWFPMWRRYTQARDKVYDWMDRYLAVRRARETESMDVLEMLMQACDEQGNPYTDEFIRFELNAVLTAGHETTGVALGWALYELGRHPDVLAKLRSELEGAGSNPDPALILTLPYLDAVCRETIRLHPILSECARVPMKPLEILGHTVPAGHALVISIVGIHHDPAVYPEPDRFLPERFINRTYNIFEFMPFGGGHRRCLGAGLAEYTMRLALFEAALNWDFEPAREDYDARLNVAMGPKYGIPLRIKARRTPNIK